MHKILSLVLSFALIWGSVVPSLAQVPGRSVGKALKMVTGPRSASLLTRTGTGVLRESTGIRILGGWLSASARRANGLRVATSAGVQGSTLSARVGSGINAAKMKKAEVVDLATIELSNEDAIFTLDQAFQEGFLVNADFSLTDPTLGVAPYLWIERGLAGTQSQYAKVLENYRHRLQRTMPGSVSSERELSLWVEQMTVVSNLGLLGGAEDASLILGAYQKVPAKYRAYSQVIVGRALLSLEAYEALEQLALSSAVDGKLTGEFWAGVKEYVQETGLSVNLPEVVPGASAAMPEALRKKLTSWCSLNEAHASYGLDVTKDWLALSKQKGIVMADEVVAAAPSQAGVGITGQIPLAGLGGESLTAAPRDLSAAGGAGNPPVEPPTAVSAAELEGNSFGSVDNVVRGAVEKARKNWLEQSVQSDASYAALLKTELTNAFKAANISPASKEAMAGMAAALEELPLSAITRREVLDSVSGRKLTALQRMGRKVMGFFSRKPVKMPTEADIPVLEEKVLETLVANSVKADLEALRNALNSSSAPLVSSEDKTFNRMENGQEISVSYTKQTFDYSQVLRDYVGQALRVTPNTSNQLGFAPQTLETGLQEFPFMYTNILLKSRAGDGLTQKRIYTVAISDKDKIFKDLKDGWTLVVDTYGNLYRTNGVKKVYYHDKKAVTVVLKNLGNMPVVVIKSVPNRLGALNNVFTIMGYSSTGRFLKDAMKTEYKDVLGPNADSWATMLTTGIYFTNLAAFLYQPLIKKYGARPVLTSAVSAILGGSLLPVLAEVFNASPEVSLAAIISAFVATGLGGAGIQQIANPTAKQLLQGKDAGSIVSAGQVWKSVGSLMTYGGFAAAVALLGAPWQAMYGILAIPAVRALVKLMKTDLPLAQAERKFANASAEKAELSKLSEKGQMSWKKFMADPKVLSIFGGLLAFCGSETMVSVATKGMINKSLEGLSWLKDFYAQSADVLSQLPWLQGTAPTDVANAFETFLTGMATMAPVLAGRITATKLMQKFNNIPKYNQKMMTISGVTALASIATLYALGPNAGPAALVPVVLTNGLLGNMFTFSFNIMKDHDKTKYNNAYSTLTGTLSTSAVVACCLIPTLASVIMPETVANAATIAFDRMIIPLALIGGAMTVINMFHHANPFSWRKPASAEVVAERQTALLDQLGIFLPQADVSTMARLVASDADAPLSLANEKVHLAIQRIKTDMAKAARISVEELEGMLADTNPMVLSEEALNKLAGTLGVRTRDLKKMAKNAKVKETVGIRIMNRVRLEASSLTRADLESRDANDLDLGNGLPN